MVISFINLFDEFVSVNCATIDSIIAICDNQRSSNV